MNQNDTEVLELAAFSHCLYPGDPRPGMFFPGGGDLVLTEAGRAVASKLSELAAAAIKGPAGMSKYRALLFLAQRSFAAGDGEASAAAASMLSDVADELLFAPAPDEADVEEEVA